MLEKVECRSTHTYPGYPVAFSWQEMRLEVDEIISEQRGPEGYTFRVRNKEHGLFVLSYTINTDQWSVEQD